MIWCSQEKSNKPLQCKTSGVFGEISFRPPRGPPLTVVSEACSRDDRHSHHDQAAAAPHVLHEELLDHDVPETLGQDQVHLVRQGPVTLLQLTHLHLQQTVRYSEQLTTSVSGMGDVTNCTLHIHNTEMTCNSCIFSKIFLMADTYPKIRLCSYCLLQGFPPSAWDHSWLYKG